MGDGRILFAESTLGVREMLLINKGCQTDSYEAFEKFPERAKEADRSIGAGFGARFVRFEDREDFRPFPDSREVTQCSRWLKRWVRWESALWERFRRIVGKIPSTPGPVRSFRAVILRLIS